jgi:choline dehydrogenase-like flavoprotein
MTSSYSEIRDRYDVIVVGARPAGAGTALLLARQGARVLLIDRGQYGSDTLSTHALMRGGVLQLLRWGVLPRIVAAGTPPVTQATFIYGDDALAVQVKPRDGVKALSHRGGRCSTGRSWTSHSSPARKRRTARAWSTCSAASTDGSRARCWPTRTMRCAWCGHRW